MEKLKCFLCAVIINCCFVVYCKSVSLTLGDTKEAYAMKGKPLLIECILNSGTIDLTSPRTWRADSVILISDGTLSSAGNGYSEILGTDRFSLNTPSLDYNADGRVYQCTYGFSQGNLNLKVYDIGSTDKSKEDCINGKSIDNCWFSLSKVIPEVSSQNLTVLYEDDTVEDINRMLNVTSHLNADGKTWAYDFKVESTSFSKFVKAITLSFKAGPISRTLTITTDCSQDIFLYGFLPVFLIVLIASIPINILKIDFLSKQFGEFTWKKVGITAVFCVIAIIIGVCLGLLIKGCDKKLLALGLSLFFGILLVVALIFALIYYHKKCESGSGVPERVLDYIQCSQLGQ